MNILICNVGSTSFKYQLIQMEDELVLAQGKMERVGSETGAYSHKDHVGHAFQKELALPNHGTCIQAMDRLFPFVKCILNVKAKGTSTKKVIPQIEKKQSPPLLFTLFHMI